VEVLVYVHIKDRNLIVKNAGVFQYVFIIKYVVIAKIVEVDLFVNIIDIELVAKNV
jgi:hypothetical protein